MINKELSYNKGEQNDQLYKRYCFTIKDLFSVLLPKKRNKPEDIHLDTISFSDIQNLYHQVGLRHGTGYLRYIYNQHKYQGVDYSSTEEILDDILTDGIRPSYDPANGKTRTDGVQNTTSLTSNRMYGRIYANKYNYEDLEFEYGFHKEWRLRLGKKVVLNLGLEGLKKNNYFHIHHKDLYKWLDHIIKDKDAYKNSAGRPAGVVNLIIGGKTDIPNNFGILIGIKKGTQIDTVPIKAGRGRKSETRATSVIAPNDFSHIEVPLKYVDQVRKAVQEKGRNFPVIALEDGEKYCSTLSMRELEKPNT